MMPDLMHQHVLYDGTKRLLVLGPVQQDRHAIEKDHVGHRTLRALTRQRQPTTWAALSHAQRQALTELGIEPEEEPEVGAPPAARPSRTEKWAINLAAAQAYREREGHLHVPRKHIETLHIDGFTHEVKLGVWIMNQRGRRATLTAERAGALTALGMRWV